MAEDRKPTEEQTAYAYLFLNDLKKDKVMAQEWKEHLDKVADPTFIIKDKINYLDNFLADNGYNTTAEAVLSLLKVGWWNDYVRSRQPNAQSDRFVQDLLQDSALYKEWGQVIQDSTTAGHLDKADQFLQQKGYDCTAIQVDASFMKMRDKNLNYWTNLYGQTIVQKEDSDPATGPAVIVYGDSTVSVGPDKLFGFKYEEGALTWTTDGAGGLLTNPHSGSITFSQINQPKAKDSYIGDIFSGTITFPENSHKTWSGTYRFVGRIGHPPDNSQGHIYSPPSVNKDWVQSLADTLAPYVMIGFALTMLFGFISKIFPQSLANYLRNSVKKAGEKIKEITSKEKPQLSEEEFSNTSTTIKQLQNEIVETADPVRQEEIREEIAQQERAEEAKYEESEREFTEEGTQAETLESELAELL